MHLREKGVLQQILCVRSLGWILIKTELQKIVEKEKYILVLFH